MIPLDEVKDKALIESWKAQAKEIELDQLDGFVRRLVTEYQHDYGTICHAVHAAMMAVLSAVNKSPVGGITGFQASCIGWMLIRGMFGVADDAPLRLVDYDDLLYPQHKDRFTEISKAVWDKLQEKAKKLLEKDHSYAHPDVVDHWRFIVSGQVPFGLKVSEHG